MIDAPPEVTIIETSDAGESKYLPVAIFLLGMTHADAVAIVVVNGNHGNGGTSAAVTADAAAQLPALLRGVADFQEQQTAAWRAKVPPPE